MKKNVQQNKLDTSTSVNTTVNKDN